MQTITEKEKKIPVKFDVDVLVVGGGPAGFSSSIASARCGAKTVLIESSGMIGGESTAGLMSHWTGDVKGPIFDELIERTKETDEDYNFYKDKILKGKYLINTEKLRLEMLEMLHEAGVEWHLFTFFSDAIVEDNKLKGIIVETKSGRYAIIAKVIIDATGDGDVSYRAGADYWIGRESDGAMQPMSIMFKIGGVDYSKAIFPGEFIDHFEINGKSIQNIGREVLPSPSGHVLLYPNPLPGVVTVNMTNSINKNGLSPKEITDADLECRRQIPHILNFLKKYAPGYENSFLLTSAARIGVRETRHIKGLYIFNENDILEGKKFDDWIATKNWFFFDMHNISGPGLDEAGKVYQKETNYFSMPYRSFVPEKIDGLLMAGRCISGTHVAHSAYRIMPICVNMGQGVGTAAAYCAKNDVNPRDADVTIIQKMLIKQGVEL